MPSLRGGWSLSDPVSGAERMRFEADGSFSSERRSAQGLLIEERAGTYATSGGELSIDSTRRADGRRTRELTTYYVSADSLAPRAMLPNGSHHGIIGQWSGKATVDELDAVGMAKSTNESSLSYRFSLDGKVTETRGVLGQAEIGGTFSIDGEGRYTLTFPKGVDASTMSVFSISNAALAEQVFQRDPP